MFVEVGQPKEVDDLVYGGKLKGGFFLEARTPSIILTWLLEALMTRPSPSTN